MSRDDLFALDCARRYGPLRPTDSDDIARLDRLTVPGGFLLKRWGPRLEDDGRNGFYWTITDRGREALEGKKP